MKFFAIVFCVLIATVLGYYDDYDDNKEECCKVESFAVTITTLVPSASTTITMTTLVPSESTTITMTTLVPSESTTITMTTLVPSASTTITITTLTATTTILTATATVTPSFNDVGCVSVHDIVNDANLVAQCISYQKFNAAPNTNGYTTNDCLNRCLSSPHTPPSYFCLSFYQVNGNDPTTGVNFYCNCRTALPTEAGSDCTNLMIRGNTVLYGNTNLENLHGDTGTEECYQIL